MNVQELIAKRARAWEAAKSFLEAHRGENGVLSAADGETYDRMEKEITDLTKEIDRLNRQAAIEAQLNQPTSAPLSNMPTSTGEKVKKGRAFRPVCEGHADRHAHKLPSGI
jgi:HK97 family phage major capsid protein